MKDILSAAHRIVLDEFACSNVLLAFDYDGTLAPIVADPEQARMRPSTRDLLAGLAKVYRVIVISGRSQPDVIKRLGGVALSAVVGNHGIERWQTGGEQASEVESWGPRLAAAVAAFKGVALEDKVYSMAVHYRQSREKKKARAAILAAAAELGDVRIIAGKQVVNILPRNAPHKGMALERERARLGCDTALYVGDDEADEDVFALDQPGRLLSIRVGAKRTSSASFCIPNQRAIDVLLRTLQQIRHRWVEERRIAR